MFTYELEQRLKELEQEQSHQDWLLQEEMNKLERELVNKNLTNPETPVTCSGEPVKQVNLQPVRLSKTNGEKTATVRPFAKSNMSSAASQNYVIRLTLNPRLPLEWSGKNWARCGQGLRYPSMEIAQKSVQQLQKRWPTEKLKIHSTALDLEMAT